MRKNFAILWVMATVLLVPLTLLQRGPAVQAAGMGVLGAAIGAVFLYADRGKPRPVLRAVLAVVVFCALLWLGQLSR